MRQTWLGTLKDPTGIDAELPKHFGEVCAVTHQAPSLGILAHCIDRGDRMASGQRGKLDPTKEEEGIGADYQCVDLVADQRGEGSFNPLGITCPNDFNLQPQGGYRVRHFLRHASAFAFFGLTSKPMREIAGTSSRKSPSCLAAKPDRKKYTPVAFPFGRARLVTRSSFIGSSVTPKTMGTVTVAALAISAGGVGPATITATWPRSSSATIVGIRSYLPSAQRYSIATLRPSI